MLFKCQHYKEEIASLLVSANITFYFDVNYWGDGIFKVYQELDNDILEKLRNLGIKKIFESA